MRHFFSELKITNGYINRVQQLHISYLKLLPMKGKWTDTNGNGNFILRMFIIFFFR